jgi:proteasome lid subunit RPN8/RPN11
MAKQVVIRGPERQSIRSAVRVSAPEEACGALIGRCDFEQHWDVTQVLILANESANPKREFLISSAAVRALEKTAAQRNAEVIGFFHSHPSGTTPSRTDLERAWPGYVYVIADASNDRELSGWTLRADRTGFEAVSVSEP